MMSLDQVQTMKPCQSTQPTRVNDRESATEHKAVVLPGLVVEVKDLQMALRRSARLRKAPPKSCSTTNKITKNGGSSQKNTSRAKRAKAERSVVRGKNHTSTGQRIDVVRSEGKMKLKIYTDKKVVQAIVTSYKLGSLVERLSLGEEAQTKDGRESVTDHVDEMEIVED